MKTFPFVFSLAFIFWTTGENGNWVRPGIGSSNQSWSRRKGMREVSDNNNQISTRRRCDCRWCDWIFPSSVSCFVMGIDPESIANLDCHLVLPSPIVLRGSIVCQLPFCRSRAAERSAKITIAIGLCHTNNVNVTHFINYGLSMIWKFLPPPSLLWQIILHFPFASHPLTEQRRCLRIEKICSWR